MKTKKECSVDYRWQNFPNVGYIHSELTDIQLEPIKREVQKIQENLDISNDLKIGHAGHIKHVYKLVDCVKYAESLLLPYAHAYIEEYADAVKYSRMNTESHRISGLKLDSLWVNFQRKGEFNPTHDHFGVISFALWLNIPYLLADEYNVYPDKLCGTNVTANFVFNYINTLGVITHHHITVDETFENKFVMFPSNMTHCVHPFYTSDKYRISISGNFIWDIT